jgi:hypothetical protein
VRRGSGEREQRGGKRVATQSNSEGMLAPARALAHPFKTKILEDDLAK